MSDKKHSDNGAHQEWCQQFGKGAIEQSAREIENFRVYGNHAPLATQRMMAEAALAIGWRIVNEVGLLSDETVEQCRDYILDDLGDMIENGNGLGPHLGHDIVDAISVAVGETPNREGSCYPSEAYGPEIPNAA
jgi:hypothetical protein